ncbi:THUMP domain-containing protein 2-like [Ylistrum balloti]|uniref:THUMP domain-containing protein 2-like n=1 Tax=Ylistrum balloti TaxID=509963 RepID=UPI002905B4E3|nr:THUMP domain-containing protein 2-like [Ylistrum balloti]
MQFFCSAGRGTEKFVAEEIKTKLGGKAIQVTDGKVFFQTGVEVAGEISQLRSIERAFVQVVRCSSLDGVKSVQDVGKIILCKDHWTSADLTGLVTRMHNLHEDGSCPESKKRRIDDEKPPVTFRISCKCAGRIGRKIQSQMLSRYIGGGLQRLVSWKVDLRNPSIEICVHMNDDRLTVGIPLQSIPVSKRSYIRHFGLRGTIAWIMSNLLDIQSYDVVLDPMCGKATLIVEACQNFKTATYLGMDISKDQLSKAAENLLWSHLHGNIGLVQGDAKCMPLDSESIDKVLCDAPFGQNFLPDCDNILEFYKQSLTEISRVLKPGGRLVLLTSQQLSLKVCGLCGQPGNKEREPVSGSEDDDLVNISDGHGQIKVTPLTFSTEESINDQQKSEILDRKSPVRDCELKCGDADGNVISLQTKSETDDLIVKSPICDSQNIFVQSDVSHHCNDTKLVLGEPVQERSGQGYVDSSSQGHINVCGCIVSDNQQLKSVNCLSKLRVSESHYVKLGETDAVICVINKIDER